MRPIGTVNTALRHALISAAAGICALGVAQADEFTRSNGPVSANVLEIIELSASGSAWARTTGGIFRTGTSGNVWNGLGRIDGYELVAQGGDRVFAFGRESLYRLDAEEEWEEFEAGQPEALVSLGGVTADADFVYLHGLDESGDARVFRAGHDATEAGDWEEISAGLPDGTLGRMFTAGSARVFVFTENDGLFHSPDQGDTWESAGIAPTTELFRVSSLGSVVMLADDATIYRSVNGGTPGTFESVTLELAEGDRLTALEVAGSALWAGTEQGELFRAANWPNFQGGQADGALAELLDDVRTGISAIAIVDGTTIVGTSGGGVLIDQGEGFVETEGPLIASEVSALMDTEVQDEMFAATFGGGIFRTEDLGQNWERVSSGLDARDVHDLLRVGSIFFAATDQGVKVSTDEAGSWSTAGSGIPEGTTIRALASSGNRLIAVSEGAIYGSTDDGGTWTEVEGSVGASSIGVGETSVFAAREGGLLVSDDDGASWSAASETGFDGTVQKVFGFPTGVFLATSEGLFRTTDGGATWTDVSEGLFFGPSGPRIVGMGEDDQGTLYASDDDGGTVVSFDAGEDWKPLFTAGIPPGNPAGNPAPALEFVATDLIIYTGFGGFGVSFALEATPGDAFGVVTPGGGEVVFDVDQGNFANVSVSASHPDRETAPDDVAFTLGYYTFFVSTIDPGSTVTVTVTYPEASRPDAVWKYGPEPGNDEDHWWEFSWDGTTGAQIEDNVITLTIVDGGRGDRDGEVNGRISDPFAPAFNVDDDDGTGVGGGGGGGVPAWLLPLLGLAVFLRRRRVQS